MEMRQKLHGKVNLIPGNLISNCRSKRRLSAGHWFSDFMMLGIMRFLMALAMQTKERPCDTLLDSSQFPLLLPTLVFGLGQVM